MTCPTLVMNVHHSGDMLVGDEGNGGWRFSEMQYEQAIVACAFGWGKEFRLYKETLYVCNRAYRLSRLTKVQFITQRALGVPSARLELRFGREAVVLRGIAAIEEARRAAE